MDKPAKEGDSQEDNRSAQERLNLMVGDLARLEALLYAVSPIDQLSAFRDFLANDARFAKLKRLVSDRRRDLDIFDVLHIYGQESVHSYFLAWLLDPQQNHDVGSHFLKCFLCRTITTAQERNIPTAPLDRIHTIDWSETEVRREWRYIDILILNRKAGFVCAIENKIWSDESIGDDGKSQLAWYRETLCQEFSGFDIHLVFLSPSGMESKDETERQFWVPEDYSTIQQLVVETIRENGARPGPEVKWFLKQYETTLRRNVVPEDSEIAKLAREIYLEHREAIELINRHKPDYAAEIKQILKEAISQQEGWVLDLEGGAYVRFRSSDWDRFESLKTGTSWGPNKSLLLFEFYCPSDPKGTTGPALVLGPGTDESIRQRLFETARQNPKVFKPSSTLRESYTRLDQDRRNLLDDSDLGDKWSNDATRNKLMELVKKYAENDFPSMNEAIVRCLEEFESDVSDTAE